VAITEATARRLAERGITARVNHRDVDKKA
jgi:hypothetical protein